MLEHTQFPHAIRLALFAGLVVPLGLGGCETTNDGGPIDTEAGSGGSTWNGEAGAPAGGGGSGGSTVQPPAALLPCDVAEVFEQHCASCHSVPGMGGAPMPLTSHDNIHSAAPLVQSETVAQRIAARIHDTNSPMPPLNAPPMSEAELAILDAWLANGAPAGSPGCAVQVGGEPPEEELPPLPAEAVCYELRVHGQSGVSNDPTPYRVGLGEHYANFYFDVPWTEPSVMLRWRTLYDNTPVLHHWLYYKTDRAVPDGHWETTIGSHLGEQVELIAGWAVGGNDMTLPEGVAAKMPPPGGKMMVEWHFYNSTSAIVEDRSGIEVCVVPESSVNPAKISGVTWLGTEFLGMPPQMESKTRDRCTPSFANLPEGEPIRIFAFNPHMHNIGTHMKSWVLRGNGDVELVFDKPFQFDHQISYRMDPPIELYRGDRIVSECTFFNNTNAHVAFGPSSGQEMCYQFAFAYPAGALDNGVFSLTGATNTCWDNQLFMPAPVPTQ